MTTPVVIALRAANVDGVKNALKGVKQAIIDTERDAVSVARAGAQARLGVVKDEMVARSKMLHDAQRETEAMLQRAFGASGRLAPPGSNTRSHTGAGASDWGQWSQAPSLFSLFKSGLDLATASLKQFASFVVSDVIKPAMALETRAVQVANNSQGQLTAQTIQSRARATGIKNNVDPMAVVDAAGVFQDLSGQPGMSFDMVDTLATISKGRGFDLGELTKMAGAIYNADRTQSKGDVEGVLLKMIHQGDTGSITLGEMAKLQGKAISPSRMLDGNFASRVGMLGALMQGGRGGMGSAADTAQGLQRFLSDALLHGDKYSPKSIAKVAGGGTKVVDPIRLIGDIFRQTGGDEGTLETSHFAVNARRYLSAFDPMYRKSYEDAKAADPKLSEKDARDKAAQVVEEFIKSFATGTTTMEAEEAKRDAVMATSGEKWDKAVNTFKDKMLGVMPAVDKLIDAFTSHSEEIALVAAVLVKAFTVLAQGALNVVEWYDRLTGNKGEGDVLKTVIDKGAGTELPWVQGENGHARGFWLHDKGKYQFIKGAAGEGALLDGSEDVKNMGLTKTLTLKGGQGVYERNGPDMSKYWPRAERGDDWVPGTLPGGEAPAAAKGSADIDAAAQGAKELTASMAKLKKYFDDLAQSSSELNRSQSFVQMSSRW